MNAVAQAVAAGGNARFGAEQAAPARFGGSLAPTRTAKVVRVAPQVMVSLAVRGRS